MDSITYPQQRKKKPTALFYFLTIFSGGMFICYWQYSMMQDINFIVGRRIMASQFMSSALFVIWVCTLIFLIVGDYMNMYIFGLSIDEFAIILAVFGSCLLIFNNIIIYRQILFMSRLELTISAVSFIIVSTVFLLFSSFPYMQTLLNRHLMVRRIKHKSNIDNG